MAFCSSDAIARIGCRACGRSREQVLVSLVVALWLGLVIWAWLGKARFLIRAGCSDRWQDDGEFVTGRCRFTGAPLGTGAPILSCYRHILVEVASLHTYELGLCRSDCRL